MYGTRGLRAAPAGRSVFTLQWLADGFQMQPHCFPSLLASPTLREKLCSEQNQEELALGKHLLASVPQYDELTRREASSLVH